MPSFGQPEGNPAIARLLALSQEFQRYPGAAPGGTGLTGLGKNDAQGYSQLLERQQEFLNLKNQLGGGKGINTRYGGSSEMPQSTLSQDNMYNAKGQHMPLQGLYRAQRLQS